MSNMFLHKTRVCLFFCNLIMTCMLISACGEISIIPVQTATVTPSQTSTSTPTLTFTPTLTPTQTLTPTPTPIPLHPINLSNASQMTQIYQLGFGTISGAAWSPDGQLLVLTSSLGIYVYDMKTFWEDKKTLSIKAFIEYPNLKVVTFSPNGEVFATGSTFTPDSTEGSIQVWQTSDLSLLHSFEAAHRYGVTTLLFSPQSDLLISGGGGDGTAKVWQMSDGMLVKSIPAFSSYISGGAFSEDGNLVYFLGNDRETAHIKSFDLTEEMRKNNKALLQNQRAFAFSSAHNFIAVSYEYFDTSLKLYDFNTLEDNGVITEYDSFYSEAPTLYSLAFSPDGSILASSDHDFSVIPTDQDGNVTLWDISSRESICTLPHQKSAIDILSFSPNGTALLTGGDSGLRLWNVKGCTPLTSFDRFAVIRDAAYTENGKVVSVAQDGSLSLWDIASNTTLYREELDERILDVAISIPGKKISLSKSSGIEVLKFNDDQISSLWKLENNEVALIDIVDIEGKTYIAYSTEFSFEQDGSVNNGSVSLVDIESQTELATFTHQKWATNLALSHNGNTIALANIKYPSGTTELLDVPTGKIAESISCAALGIFDVQFSFDDAHLALACMSKTTLYDLLKGRIIWSASRDQGMEIYSLAFSSDGLILAAGDREGKIMLWDVTSGEQIAILSGHIDKINSLTFSEDGTILVSGSEDGTIRIWGVP